MPPVFTSLILATTVVATLAVGVASASFIHQGDVAAPKADRLPVTVADNHTTFVTVETRAAEGTSVVHKVELN
jgi:hypothetical protein